MYAHRLVKYQEANILQFEKIFAINLPERTDHRDALILASRLSEFNVDFIDGVHGETIAQKAIPVGHEGLGPSHIGAWRGHMNAISESVVLFSFFNFC